MKHILNNLTEEEKNSIREQHTGGMKVMTENFNKLLNSKLGDAKPLVNEQIDMGDDSPRYKYRLGHLDNWYDEKDNTSDDFEDYDEEMEFGPDDYEEFISTLKGVENKWNPSFRKHYYDKYTEHGPLKLRKKRI